ncbi:MAG: hypothetical protein WC582_00070 [Patescibacteria group bacterium]
MFNFLKATSGRLLLYFYSSIIIIGAIVFICASLFLYKNFYQTITRSQEILVLRREVAVEDIDMNKFDEIVKKIEIKIQPRTIETPIKF